MASSDLKAVGFSTLTHARIRAGQGDRSGARRILRAILEQEPWNREARDFFDRLAGRDTSRPAAGAEPVPVPPVEATAEELAARFRQVLEGGADPRIERLTVWLGRISDKQGGDDAQ